MAFYILETSIAWHKSIMKAFCQLCHCGDNEDALLLCDGSAFLSILKHF
jgi:hypothetical protein